MTTTQVTVPAPLNTAPGEPLLDFSSFTTLATSAFVPLAIGSKQRGSFRASVRTAAIDRLTFTELFASAHEVERTPRLIAEGGDCYMVGVMLAGSGILVQDGRDLVLREGDITIYDTLRPFSLSFGHESRNLVVRLPKDAVNLPPELVGELTATNLSRVSGAGMLASEFLLHLPEALHGSFHEAAVCLERTSINLLETLLTMALGTDRLEQDPHNALLRKIREYIETNLGCPDLSPGQIATAHHISTRYLHGLFRSQQTTVSRYIRTRRLEYCHRDLRNPVFADRPVSAVAARYGFIDAAHFSRIFRSHFGTTPTEVRSRREPE